MLPRVCLGLAIGGYRSAISAHEARDPDQPRALRERPAGMSVDSRQNGTLRSALPSSVLPRRVYEAATVAAADPAATGPGPQGFRILLDGKPARTPRRTALVLPTAALAEAVATE